MTNKILLGNNIDTLKTIPDNYVNCCITSPPYYGLRDYGIDEQIGLEETPEEYIQKLVSVFREVKRVLKADGTLWVNIGSTYSNKKINSLQYIVRRDISNNDRKEIAKAMSAVWAGYESPEQAMSKLLCKISKETRELYRESMSVLRKEISGTQDTSEKRVREILLSEVCKETSGQEKRKSYQGSMYGMQKNCGKASFRHKKECKKIGFLLFKMLVSVQSKQKSLSLGRRARRENEQGNEDLAKYSHKERQGDLSPMPFKYTSRSSSNKTISKLSRIKMRYIQWDNALSKMPSFVRQKRNGNIRRVIYTSEGSAFDDLANLTFLKNIIPDIFIFLCEPVFSIKQKDDIGIPAMLAFALREDGWYLRQDIIWHKPNPMPESVTDRCTKSHEYIFLLSKSKNYYFNSEAIKERAVSNGNPRPFAKVGNNDRNDVDNIFVDTGYRQKRDVWTVCTKPYNGAHFAVFPEKLILPCILAGCPENGIVLDPFIGSGTTALVAVKNMRKYIGCELNPEYVKMAEQRIAKETGLWN